MRRRAIAASDALDAAPRDVASDVLRLASLGVAAEKLAGRVWGAQVQVATPETLLAALSVESPAVLALCKPGVARSAE